MKRRFYFLMIFLSVLMLTQAAISGTWTDTNSNNTFSFTGTTVSTSTGQGGHGTTYYRVSGSADISGTADALGDNTVYNAKMWLMVSGDINSSPFPGKGNIDTKKITNGVFYDTYTSGAAKILYKSHPVGSLANFEFDPTQAQAQNSLSDSTSSPTYVKGSYTSPSGLSACPEVYGSLSGTLMNHVGSKSVTSLMFQSDANCAEGDSDDDGSENVVSEKCHRKQNCKKPGTATRAYSHRVKCPENIWVLAGEFFKVKRYKKQACPSYWWTCDDDPNNPSTVNQCLRSTLHVKPGERSWQWKYVSPNGSVSQSPPNLACGHSLLASGDHSLQASCSTDSSCISTNFYLCSHSHSYPSTPTDNTPDCSYCTDGCSSCQTPSPPPPPPSTTSCSAGHPYNPNNSSAVNRHRTRTCRFSECGQTWQACVNGSSAPLCNKPYRNQNGLSCWAQ